MGTLGNTVKTVLKLAIVGVGVTFCVLLANVMVLREDKLTHGSERSKRQTIVPDSTGGAMFVRWGRSDCPDTNTERVYKGYVGGSHYSHAGGGSNYVCLTDEPVWGTFSDTNDNEGRMYGAEYRLTKNYDNNLNFPFTNDKTKLLDHNVPCAVCRSKERVSKLMIPGTNVCASGWTSEYHGYLVTSHFGHTAQHDFVCMDENPVPSDCGYSKQDGAMFHSVEGECGSLPCPPYVQNRELTCVVCTR